MPTIIKTVSLDNSQGFTTKLRQVIPPDGFEPSIFTKILLQINAHFYISLLIYSYSNFHNEFPYDNYDIKVNIYQLLSSLNLKNECL